VLSEELMQVAALLAEWEGMDFASFCRAGIICMMQSSWDDMETIHRFPLDSQQEGRLALPSNYVEQREWSNKFHPPLLQLMRELGTKTVAHSHIPNLMPQRPFSESEEESEAILREKARQFFETIGTAKGA
jgi:hypothetical protein